MASSHQPDKTSPAVHTKGHLHKRWMWGDRKLADDTAALRYRDIDNFPEHDWRSFARENFPEPLETPSRLDRVHGERPLRERK